MKTAHQRKATLTGFDNVGFVTFTDATNEVHHLRYHQVEKELAKKANVGTKVILQYKTDNRSGLWYAVSEDLS